MNGSVSHLPHQTCNDPKWINFRCSKCLVMIKPLEQKLFDMILNQVVVVGVRWIRMGIVEAGIVEAGVGIGTVGVGIGF